MRLGADVAPGDTQGATVTGYVRYGRRGQSLEAEGEGAAGRGTLTDEAEDVVDGGHEDDEDVDQEDETEGDGDVHGPAERFVREQDLKHGPADLQAGNTVKNKYSLEYIT